MVKGSFKSISSFQRAAPEPLASAERPKKNRQRSPARASAGGSMSGVRPKGGAAKAEPPQRGGLVPTTRETAQPLAKQSNGAGRRNFRLLGNGPGVGVSWIKGVQARDSAPRNSLAASGRRRSILPWDRHPHGPKPCEASREAGVRWPSGHRARPASAGAAKATRHWEI